MARLSSNLADLRFPLFFMKSESFISEGCLKLWTAICRQRLYICIRRQFSVGSSDVALLESARDCNWVMQIHFPRSPAVFLMMGKHGILGLASSLEVFSIIIGTCYHNQSNEQDPRDPPLYQMLPE
ncbi:hypothetical protein Q3G72_030784 [Acer saccharum]|nr:hypothetical protein Q3G72_030784 [Acer saccharum]